MEVRILLTGNAIFIFVFLSTLYYLFFGNSNNHNSMLSFAITYSIVLVEEICSLVTHFCDLEKKLVSVERIA
jgi:hypothetical protein